MAEAAAAAAATPVAPAPTAEASGIDAILGDLASEGESNAPANEGDAESDAALDALTQQAQPEPEPDKPADEPEPSDPAQRLDDEVIFSDEALATPEGIAKARTRIHQLRKLSHSKYIELKKFQGRIEKRHARLQHEVKEYVSDKRTNQLLLDNVRSNLQGLHSGDPNAILTALGNLTGQDGFKAYELITSHIVNRGKPALDPQIQAILERQNQTIEELRRGSLQEKTQQQVAQVTQQIEGHKAQIGSIITGQAQQLPHLARLYAEDPQAVVNHIVNEIEEAHVRGTPVDGRQYFVHLESQLARHLGGGQAPKGDGGPAGPANKQPAQSVQRSPGQSVGPRTAALANPREPTEDESLRALANDDALMSSLGF